MTDDESFKGYHRHIITLGLDAETPLNAFQLISKVSSYLSSLYDKHILNTYPHPPFFVKDVIFDMVRGEATLYLYWQ